MFGECNSNWKSGPPLIWQPPRQNSLLPRVRV